MTIRVSKLTKLASLKNNPYDSVVGAIVTKYGNTVGSDANGYYVPHHLHYSNKPYIKVYPRFSTMSDQVYYKDVQLWNKAYNGEA